MLGGRRPRRREDIKLWISHVTSHEWSRNQRVIWHYGWVSLIISHYPGRFGCYGCCRRGDILFLFCHVTSWDHVVRGSSDIMVSPLHYNSPSCQVGSHRQCSRKKISILFSPSVQIKKEYIYIYLYLYLYLYCIYIYVFYICIYIFVYIYIYMYIYTIYLYISIYLFTYSAYMYMHLSIYLFVYLSIHIYIYIYKCIIIFIYIPIQT